MLLPTSIIAAKGYIEVMNNTTNNNAIIKFQQFVGTATEMEEILSLLDTVDDSPSKHVVVASALSMTLEMINQSSVGNICLDSGSLQNLCQNKKLFLSLKLVQQQKFQRKILWRLQCFSQCLQLKLSLKMNKPTHS